MNQLADQNPQPEQPRQASALAGESLARSVSSSFEVAEILKRAGEGKLIDAPAALLARMSGLDLIEHFSPQELMELRREVTRLSELREESKRALAARELAIASLEDQRLAKEYANSCFAFMMKSPLDEAEAEWAKAMKIQEGLATLRLSAQINSEACGHRAMALEVLDRKLSSCSPTPEGGAVYLTDCGRRFVEDLELALPRAGQSSFFELHAELSRWEERLSTRMLALSAAFSGLNQAGFGTEWEVLDAAAGLSSQPGGFPARRERFLAANELIYAAGFTRYDRLVSAVAAARLDQLTDVTTALPQMHQSLILRGFGNGIELWQLSAEALKIPGATISDKIQRLESFATAMFGSLGNLVTCSKIWPAVAYAATREPMLDLIVAQRDFSALDRGFRNLGYNWCDDVATAAALLLPIPGSVQERLDRCVAAREAACKHGGGRTADYTPLAARLVALGGDPIENADYLERIYKKLGTVSWISGNVAGVYRAMTLLESIWPLSKPPSYESR